MKTLKACLQAIAGLALLVTSVTVGLAVLATGDEDERVAENVGQAVDNIAKEILPPPAFTANQIEAIEAA